MRILVVYATTHGHTGKVAARVAAVLRRGGADVHLTDVGHAGDLRPADFDGVVAAASIHRGRHQPEMAAWLSRHHTSLAERPAALLSVSLSAADEHEEGRADARECIDTLLDETGWSPDVALPIAGALEYREYDLPTRVLMRLIARRHHQPTDVSRDVDYTDWEAVERFAEAFGRRVAAVRGGAIA